MERTCYLIQQPSDSHGVLIFTCSSTPGIPNPSLMHRKSDSDIYRLWTLDTSGIVLIIRSTKTVGQTLPMQNWCDFEAILHWVGCEIWTMWIRLELCERYGNLIPGVLFSAGVGHWIGVWVKRKRTFLWSLDNMMIWLVEVTVHLVGHFLPLHVCMTDQLSKIRLTILAIWLDLYGVS